MFSLPLLYIFLLQPDCTNISHMTSQPTLGTTFAAEGMADVKNRTKVSFSDSQNFQNFQRQSQISNKCLIYE